MLRHARSRAAARRAAVLPLFALLLVAACDDDPAAPLPQLAIDPLVMEALGDEHRLVLRADGEPTDVDSWSGLDPHIISVSADGRIVAVSPGAGRVQARVGGRVAEGQVQVLMPVDIAIVDRQLTPMDPGQERITLRLRNLGGRGAYRIEVYRRGDAGESIPVWIQPSESPAPVGMDVTFQLVVDVPEGEVHGADWVVVRAREANRDEFFPAWCDLLYGAGYCVIP